METGEFASTGHTARVLAAAISGSDVGIIPSVAGPTRLDFDSVGLTDPPAATDGSGAVHATGNGEGLDPSPAGGAPSPYDFDAERPAGESVGASGVDLGLVLGQTWQGFSDDHPHNTTLARLLPPASPVSHSPPVLKRVRVVCPHGLVGCDLADDRGRVVDTRFGNLIRYGQSGGFAEYRADVEVDGGRFALVVFTDLPQVGLSRTARGRLLSLAALTAGLVILTLAVLH